MQITRNTPQLHTTYGLKIGAPVRHGDRVDTGLDYLIEIGAANAIGKTVLEDFGLVGDRIEIEAENLIAHLILVGRRQVWHAENGQGIEQTSLNTPRTIVQPPPSDIGAEPPLRQFNGLPDQKFQLGNGVMGDKQIISMVGDEVLQSRTSPQNLY